MKPFAVTAEADGILLTFGSNVIAEQKRIPFWKLCWDAVHDFVLIMLICFAVISIAVTTATSKGWRFWRWSPPGSITRNRARL